MSVDLDVLGWLEKEESVSPAIQVRSTTTDSLITSDVPGTCFEIQREVLLHLLEQAISVVPSRDMVPILTNFQFQVADSKLTVIGSSHEMSIVVSTDQVDTKVSGVEVLPARTLLTIVKEATAGNRIFIEVTPLGAVIVCGSFSSQIALAANKGFPIMDALDKVVFYDVDRSKFLDAIQTVKYALPNKDFSGQASLKFINIKGGKFTACDGSRFQQTRIDDFNLNMKLPSDNISLLVKMLSSSDLETLEIGETKEKLVFRLANTVLYINKLDSPYPNVEQLWLRPALNNDQPLHINRQELITAIKKVRFAVESVNNSIGLQIESDNITIIAKDTTKSATDVIACKWSGNPRTVVVNCMHLAEMLKAYNKPTCVFMLDEDSKNHKSPILLKDEDTLSIATISQLLAYRAGL